MHSTNPHNKIKRPIKYGRTYVFLVSTIVVASLLPVKYSLAQPESAAWRETLERLANYYQQQPAKAAEPNEPTEPARLAEAISISANSSPANSSSAEEATAAVPPQRFLTRFLPDEELVFTLYAEDFERGEIFGISSETGLKLGLSELGSLLNFQVDLNRDATAANGWFFSQNSPFSLTTRDDGTLLINSLGQALTVPASDYIIDGDILLEVDTLARMFGVTFSVDEGRLRLNVSADRQFAFESAQARRSRLTGSRFSRAPSVLPPIDNGYSLYSVPLLDAQFALRKSDTSTFTGYSFAASQDLAYTNTQLFLAGDSNDELRDARITLNRESADGTLFEPLGLTNFSIGDVLPINAGVGTTPGFGRGVSFGNVRTNLADNRLVNFTGLIQEGWDVELYRNGILLRSSFDIQEGRYEFTDIELLFGNNDFELVFYGPQGQIQRETKSYLVDRNALNKGQSSFRFSMVDSNETVLGINRVSDDPAQKGLNTAFVYEQGITDWYSFGLGGTYFMPDVGDNFSTLSLRNNISLGQAGLINSVIQFNSEQQKNYLINYRARLGGHSLSVNWRQNNRVLSNSASAEDVATADSDTQELGIADSETIDLDTLRLTPETSIEQQDESLGVVLNGRLKDVISLPVSYQSAWQQSWNNGQRSAQSFSQSLSANTPIGGFNYSFVGSNSAIAEGSDNWEYTSNLGYRNRFGRLYTRLFATYIHQPDSQLNSVGAAVNYPFTNTLNGELRYAYNTQNSASSYNARLNWLGESVSLSSFATYSDNGTWNVSVLARFGLGLNADKQSFSMSPRPISTGGALAVRVFEDKDMDGNYDQDEPLLDDVGVKGVQVSREATTQKGMAFLSRLPKQRRTDIVIDESTLPDYTYVRTDEGFSVTGRPGLLQFADIPVVRSGEIDGTVYLNKTSGEEIPLAYVTLHLVNQQDEIVASTKSEYDGFYLFDKILPGEYSLNIDTRDLSKQNAALDIK